MRFVVELYRYLIIAILGLMVTGAAYGLVKMFSAGVTIDSGMGIYIAAVVIGVVGVIVALGFTATMISVHDRHAEIADELRMLREHLTGGAGQE